MGNKCFNNTINIYGDKIYIKAEKSEDISYEKVLDLENIKNISSYDLSDYSFGILFKIHPNSKILLY